MKYIKLGEAIEIDYKEEVVRLKDGPALVPDALAKAVFEVAGLRVIDFAIPKEKLKNLNKDFKSQKRVLVLIDLDAFDSIGLIPVLKALSGQAKVDIYPFVNKDIFRYFGFELLKEIPSLEEASAYDSFYTLFEEDLALNGAYLDKNRTKFFEEFFGVKGVEIEPFVIQQNPKGLGLINSEGFYKLNLKDKESITSSINISANNFTKKTLSKIEEMMKKHELIVTSHPGVAYLCHLNKIPCVFVVGGFDALVFGDYSYVKVLRNPYVGNLCSAPCMRNQDLCVEARAKGLDTNPCMNIETIPESFLDFSKKKINLSLESVEVCKFCREKTTHRLYDIIQGKMYKTCEACDCTYAEKEEYDFNKDLAKWGIPGFFSFYENVEALSLLEKKHNIEIAYFVKSLKPKGSILVYKALSGEISHLLKSFGFEVISFETDKELKDIGFVMFGTEYQDEYNLEDVELVLIPDITYLEDLSVLKAFKEKDIVIGAYNKNALLKTLGRYIEGMRSSLSERTLFKILNSLGKDAYIYNSSDVSANKEFFGEFLSSILNLGNNITLSLFEAQNFFKYKLNVGNYLIASSKKLDKNVSRHIDMIKWNIYEKSAFSFHSTRVISQDEPYLKIYHEGKKGKVLLMDHWELIENYPKLFAQADYTVGIVRKDLPFIDIKKLESEVREFAPDFMFSGVYGDLLWMRNENVWDAKPKDFWFKFDFPIISYKVDHPFISFFGFSEQALDIFRKYNHKFALIHHDKALSECFKTLGIKHVYWLPSTGLWVSQEDIPRLPNTLDVVFVGSTHTKSQETYEKYKDYIDCYKDDVTDIRKCLNIPCIKDGFFNKEFFDIQGAVISYVRAEVLELLKEKFKERFFSTGKIPIPYSRLKHILNKAKVSFYIHSQSISALHDMAFNPLLYDTLPIVDRKEEAFILFPEHYTYFTYTNLEDAIKKIEHYLSHEDERIALTKELKEYTLKQGYIPYSKSRLDMIEQAYKDLKKESL